MAKKTKKIETPIDRRETFVSIQKNFADSDLSVSEKLQTLYALQQADTAIDKIIQFRGELPMEVEALENEIAELKAKAARSSEIVDEYNRSINENKLAISEIDAQAEKYKTQLENIENSREYDSLNKEIENLGYERQIAEKYINETKARIYEKKNELEIIKEKLAIRNEDLKAKREELATIVESTSKEEEALQTKREACAEKIDERTMSAYNHIRQSCNNRLAVVSIFNGDSCGGCFNTIAPQRLIDIASNRKMIVCEYCGRILVNPDFE